MPERRQADLPERHRSLAAALDWSWRLLTAKQQRLLACVSVFRGGWTLEAVEAVCQEPHALELLADLGDASLISSAAEETDSGVRFRLLEMVRDFSQEKLAALSEQALLRGEQAPCQERHAGFFGALAERAVPELRGPQQNRWLDVLEADHDNLRAALDWHLSSLLCLQAENPEAGLRLASALVPFWRARGHLWEGHRRCLMLLECPAAGCRTAARADALNGAGELTTLLTRYCDAERLHEEALCVAREIQSRIREAEALLGLGTVFYWRQEYAAAERLFEESRVKLWSEAHQGEQETEQRRVSAERAVCHSLGNLALRQGNYAKAQSSFGQALMLRRGLEDTLGVAATVGGLGQTARAAGDAAAAMRHFGEALRLFDAAGQRWTAALCLSDLGRLAAAQGPRPRSARLLGAAASLRERFHFPPPPLERAGNEDHLAALRDRLGASAFEAAWAEGKRLSWEQVIAYTLDTNFAP